MKYIKEKIAYLKGFADGVKLGEQSDEGKALIKVMEILGDVTDALEGLARAQSEMEDYVEAIDEDLDDLEEFVMDLALDDEDWDDLFDDDDFDDDDDDLYEVICPECGEEYYTDFESFEDNDVYCPFCEAHFELGEDVLQKLTAGEDLDEDDCPCCHHHEDEEE